MDLEQSDEILWARFADAPPPFARERRRTGRRAQGVRYERKVHEHFKESYGDAYFNSPWIQYMLVGGSRIQWCQPDALLFDLLSGRITIVEVKYQHTLEAWKQLHKYLSVVRKIFGGSMWSYSLCEVVKWYDCATRFPEPVHLLSCLEESKAGYFHVHIFKA